MHNVSNGAYVLLYIALMHIVLILTCSSEQTHWTSPHPDKVLVEFKIVIFTLLNWIYP